MEIAIRLPIFYMLENTLNNIVMVPREPNCYLKNTVNLIKNHSLVSEEVCYGLAEENSSSSAKINLIYVLIISICMILAATPLKSMFRSIKWLTPSTLLLWTVNYFYNLNITLSKYSVTALRIMIYIVVVYAIYKQLGMEYQEMNKCGVLNWLPPVTLWLWNFDYFYDYTAHLSNNSLTALRVLIFFIVCYSIYIAHQHQDIASEMEEMELMAATVFLLFAFGPKAAEVQFHKYDRLAYVMCCIFDYDRDEVYGKIGILIYLLFSFIELWSLNYCHPWSNFEWVVMDWTSLEQIYHADCVTLLILYSIITVLLYCNTFILKTIQRKIFQNYNHDRLYSNVIVYSPVAHEISAIYSSFLSMNDESRWNAVQIVCLIISGEFLFHLYLFLYEILIDSQLEKKLHYKALGMCLLSIISAIFLLFFSLRKFTFTIHLFLFVFLAFYVIILTSIVLLKYTLINLKLYRESVEGLHWDKLLHSLDVVVMCSMYFCHAVSFYLLSTSEGFGFRNFLGAYNYLLTTKQYVVKLKSTVINFVKARKFIYFLSEIKPEALKALDDVCLICHEGMTFGCVTACKHHYHRRCLLAWLYKNKKCPLCRFQLYY